MAYEPHFSISPRLLSRVESVAALRERIQSATIELSWGPALQKDTRTRIVPFSDDLKGEILRLQPYDIDDLNDLRTRSVALSNADPRNSMAERRQMRSGVLYLKHPSSWSCG